MLPPISLAGLITVARRRYTALAPAHRKMPAPIANSLSISRLEQLKLRNTYIFPHHFTGTAAESSELIFERRRYAA